MFPCIKKGCFSERRAPSCFAGTQFPMKPKHPICQPSRVKLMHSAWSLSLPGLWPQSTGCSRASRWDPSIAREPAHASLTPRPSLPVRLALVLSVQSIYPSILEPHMVGLLAVEGIAQYFDLVSLGTVLHCAPSSSIAQG